MLQPGQCPPGQGIRPLRPGWVVGWWTGDTVLSPPTDFFRQGLPRAAFNEAPMIEHTEPPVLPSATDHGAGGARVRQSANKALPRSDDGDQAQPHVPHACARKPAKQPPPRVEVLAIEAEVARGLARLTALSSMAEPQQRQLSCAYCRWDRQPRHTVECCLHKPGCCVCGQAHKGRDCDHLPEDMKAAQQALQRARWLGHVHWVRGRALHRRDWLRRGERLHSVRHRPICGRGWLRHVHRVRCRAVHRRGWLGRGQRLHSVQRRPICGRGQRLHSVRQRPICGLGWLRNVH